MVDLRLIGVASRERPVRQLTADVLPWTWISFVLAAISGFLMFSSSATKYLDDGPFRVKLALLVLAGVNMAVFHCLPYRRVQEWDRAAPPLAAKLAGGVSLLLWIGIVFCGRWVGFTT
jgi:hypothetical protein